MIWLSTTKSLKERTELLLATGKKKLLWETLQVKQGKCMKKWNVHRSIVKEHIPKKWGDLENPITHTKVFDNSHDRIHGEKKLETYDTFNHKYGATKDPVDEIKTFIEANVYYCMNNIK